MTIAADRNLTGNVPAGWSVVPLKEVLLKSQYGLNSSSRNGGAVPIVGMKDIQGGRVNSSSLASIDLDLKTLDAYRLRPGDILLNRTNSPDLVGKIGIFTGDVLAVFASYLVRLQANSEIINPHFLNAWLNADPVQHIIDRVATRAISQANINPTRFLEECFVPIPPMLEQCCIASILAIWDAAIEKAEALLAANANFYTALARRFFDPCHQSFNVRPNSWREFELGGVFSERSQPGSESDRLLSITMNGGVIDRDDVGRKDTSTEDKSHYKLILPGDIGYNTMRMWQGVSGLSVLRGIISPAYTVVTPIADRIVGRYAAHLFKSPRMIFVFERYSQGLTSDTWNLKFPAFSKIKVFLPPIEEQRRQADLLDIVTAKGSLLERQLEAVALQKRGLMQKLLTGKIRVPEAVATLSPAAE